MSDYDWSGHLEEGEELLWQGRPHSGFHLFMSSADFLLVPVSVLFLAGSLMAPPSIVVIGPVLGYILFGRGIIDMLRRRPLRYAVTSGRVLRAHKRLGILTKLRIHRNLKIDAHVGRYTTLVLDPWSQNRVRLPGIIDPFGLNAFLVQALFVGHFAEGTELRLIADGHEVSALLKRLRGQAMEIAA
jgi:hypothetical protein